MTLTQMGLVDKKHSTTEGLELVVSSVKMEIWFEMKGLWPFPELSMLVFNTMLILELRVVITRKEDSGVHSKLLDFSLMAVEMEMVQRPFDMNLVLRLGGVSMEQTVNGVTRKAITTPMSDGKADYLFTTRLLIVSLILIQIEKKQSNIFYRSTESLQNFLSCTRT